MYDIGSLFSGIGGIEYGFERTGSFRTMWFIEKDPYAQQIIRKHWGTDARIYEDITKVDFNTVPKVDILTGGFPCQDISLAGTGAGITGSRSSLWKYYKEAIRILRPKFAFIENVSILINRGLNVVLSDFAEVGYDAEWYCVPSSAIGSPHQRDRLFILAYPKLCGCVYRQTEKQSTERGKQTFSDFISDGTDVSDSDSSRPINKGFDVNKSNRNEQEKDKEWKRKSRIRVEFKDSVDGRSWWSSEPKLGRVANGIPYRVDRIRCLGNAVVPQVAEVFAEAIKERLN